MTDVFAMGGYGSYVWSSFGLAFIVVVICIAQAQRRHQRMLREIQLRIEAADRTGRSAGRQEGLS